MALELKLALPRFIVLKSNDKTDYMGYIHENGSSHGYVRFMETQPVSPYVKFEMETSDIDGLETDQFKESCTLFKPISVDLANNTVRIIHVQSGCYLCLWRFNNPAFTRCVLANYKSYDSNSCDIFKFIDWDSLLILPRYVTFRGDNDNYLCLHQVDNLPYLQFGTKDPGDANVTCEIFYTDDGNIRINTLSNNKFWRLTPNWIRADSSDTSSNNKDTLFRPVKFDDETIALLNLGNNRFCKRLTIEGKTDCLNAATTSVTEFARLKVEEDIMTRE
ncbi:hypothetical protein REPUB_Repub06bG0037400 [Reevesia pubescens]